MMSKGPGQIHHRGEHAFGEVRGFDHVGEAQYVPRAGWSSSMASPLKNPTLEFDADRFLAEGKDNRDYKRTMAQYIQRELGKQVEEKDAGKRDKMAATQEAFRSTNADVGRKQQEEKLVKENLENTKKVFREGLAEQREHQRSKAMDGRLREAHEAAEIKLRTTQQLCQELGEAARRKDEDKREFAETMQQRESQKLQQRAERSLEHEELRRTMREQFQGESHRHNAQQDRVKDAMASQEACYAYFAKTQGKEEAERIAKEVRRVDRDEQHHQLRTDMMYAQREMARDRQRQRMRQTLDDQMDAKHRMSGTVRIQQDYEKTAVNQAGLLFMEEQASRVRAKKAEEVENQAMLIDQMHARQQRLKKEHGQSYKPGTMEMSPSLLSTAQASRGGFAGSPDLMTKLDAAIHLSKPCGKPEIKPWVDIATSYGPGGVVGVFAGEGPTRSVLMCTGGPGRLLTKAVEIASRDRDLRTKWHEGVSSGDLKAARQVAAKRLEASATDKALTHPP